MFEIRQAYSVGPRGDDEMMVDEGRDAWVQRISNMSFDVPGGQVFKLVWGDRVIPFDVLATTVPIEGGGSDDYYVVRKFHTFGSSAKARLAADIETYHFADDAERRAAMMLAIEAVLAYGSNYDGPIWPEGHYRFGFEGRTYTKKDFGLS